MKKRLAVLEVWIGGNWYDQIQDMADESGETVEQFLVNGLIEWIRDNIPETPSVSEDVWDRQNELWEESEEYDENAEY
jgi:hypothetical protein